jgi:GTP cyclohydrolase I
VSPREPAHGRLDTGGDEDSHPIDTLAPASLLVTEDERDWAALHPRHISPEDWQEFEASMSRIFAAMGMPMDGPATSRTPTRFLRALFDATEGYEGDEKIVTAFPTECHGGPDCEITQVVEGPIPFFALCEHHSLPFFGHVHIGYVAHENILGLSKLTRLVRLFARRFTVQERIGQQLADSLVRILAPHGVAVSLDAVHLCTQMRGVREIQSRTRTTYWRGNYEHDPNLRMAFFHLCEDQGRLSR